jgi:hypothetical protein
MTRSPRFWAAVAFAALALVIGANWHLVTVAFTSQPGCVATAPDRAAAKPGC